jgi:hypothetical protein
MSHSDFDHRHYVVISASDVPNIDFTQVMETSAETLRFSVDGTLTFVKYEGDMPSSVTACSSKSQEYSHSEILAILNADDGVWWTPPPEDTP